VLPVNWLTVALNVRLALCMRKRFAPKALTSYVLKGGLGLSEIVTSAEIVSLVIRL